MNEEIIKLIESKKKNKRLKQDEITVVQGFLKKELKNMFGKECKAEASNEFYKLMTLLPPEITAEVISDKWQELNTNIIQRWVKDFNEGINNLKCGVKLALNLIRREQFKKDGWKLFEDLVQEILKQKKKIRDVFFSSLFNKDDFLLRNLLPENSVDISGIYEPLWNFIQDKSFRSVLDVAEWIWQNIKDDSSGRFNKLQDSIRKSEAIKLCRRTALRFCDDITNKNSNTNLSFDPVDALSNLKRWIDDKEKEVKRLQSEKRQLESEKLRLHTQVNSLLMKSNRQEEKIEELKEEINDYLKRLSKMEQYISELKEINESLTNEINTLKDEYKMEVEHLKDRIDKLPEIRINEFKNKTASKLRVFWIDIKSIKEEEINTNMERVLYGLFLKFFDILKEQGINISG